MGDDDWLESTEGDLDPDLTEEAGYGYWEPPRHRAWMPAVLRIGMAVVLVLLLGSVLVAAIR